MPNCPVCNRALFNKGSSWSYQCSDCNHWVAKLEPKIENTQDAIFENVEESGDAIYFLDDIRRKTSKIILDQLALLGSGRLLDIGCASGLFLSLATQRGFEIHGIEPNPKMAECSLRSGIPTKIGFFPDVLGSEERFNLITFNDVLEHIENVDAILDGCHKHLRTDGLLSINVPNCNGFFFQISKLLNYFGYTKPWGRLWQTMFYTPHLHYFSPTSLIKLANSHNFIPVTGPIYLPVIGLSGLWNRLSADAEASVWTRVLQYGVILAIYPLYALATKDAFFVVFKKID